MLFKLARLALVLILSLIFARLAFTQQQPVEQRASESGSGQLSPQEIKRKLYDAIHNNKPDQLETFIGFLDEKERDELFLYSLGQVKRPSLEMLRVFLDKGANVNPATRYKTPLMYAASEGYDEGVKVLLARGALVNVQTDEGTPLMMAVTGGHTEAVKLLLAAGADVKAIHRIGDQALIMAARQRSYRSPAPEPNAEIMRLLLANGAEPNARGQWGRTALMSANTTAKVKLLVTHGADVNVKDEAGQTALIKAADRGDAAVASELLGGGADVNAADREGSNALLFSLSQENYAHDKERETLPVRRLEVARKILLAEGLDVNAQNQDGETALMRAVRLENIEMIQLLLARGADANRSDVFGDTAVVLAYKSENVEIEKLFSKTSLKRQPQAVLNAFLRAAVTRKDEIKVKHLLAQGADPNHEYAIGYDHKTIKRTVLILAASGGHARIVRMLLNKGANVNAQGLLFGSESGLKYGTALEAAEASNHSEVAVLLKKAMM